MSNRQVEKMKFEFRQGARYSVKPDVVGVELERVRGKRGSLTPLAVVEASVPLDAPLHPVFEWDDAKAGVSYRVFQARNLIRSIRVIGIDSTESVRVYVHVPQESAIDEDGDQLKSGYQPMRIVVTRPDLYAAALSALSHKFNAAKAALEELKHAAVHAPDTDQDRMARLTIAVQAMQTASAAVNALH